MKSQKKYDREFKINTVKLCQESDKPIGEIARDLGISKSNLYAWIQEYKEHGESSFPSSGIVKPCNEELYRLKKELADVTMERDILKKAIAIFSKPKGTR